MVANPATTSVAGEGSNTSYFSRHGNISTRSANQIVDHSKLIQHYRSLLNQQGHAPNLMVHSLHQHQHAQLPNVSLHASKSIEIDPGPMQPNGVHGKPGHLLLIRSMGEHIVPKPALGLAIMVLLQVPHTEDPPLCNLIIQPRQFGQLEVLQHHCLTLSVIPRQLGHSNNQHGKLSHMVVQSGLGVKKLLVNLGGVRHKDEIRRA